MLSGDFTSTEQIGNAVIGQTLADYPGVKLGDKVERAFPKAETTQLTVTGIFNTGTPLDETVAFVSLDTRKFLDEAILSTP